MGFLEWQFHSIIAKPHLKTAVKGIVSDIASNIMIKKQTQDQDESGLILIAHKNQKEHLGANTQFRIKGVWHLKPRPV